jgi:LytS/YehU family sensor histidine kinase
MSVEWFKNEKKRKELENEKLKAELQALRAQIDPHFFFNVLNNICSLARKKSDDTEAFIIRLSELIRYSLYENKGEKFFLEKEITFLKNYIEIQQMRLDKNAEISFDYSDTDVNLMIEPMLLFPFVENAFKHGVSYRDDGKISISIKTIGSVLYFEIKNPLIQDTRIDKAGGIGIVNVKKRLDLLYPNRHKLEIDKNSGIFSVKLRIDL